MPLNVVKRFDATSESVFSRKRTKYGDMNIEVVVVVVVGLSPILHLWVGCGQGVRPIVSLRT